MSEAQAVTPVESSNIHRRGSFPVALPAVPAGLDMGTAMVTLRHLHFYRDLLRLGFEGTIWPDRGSRTLRSERLALGIDLPELDLVAAWAARCGDGRVAIPFIEYLLARVRETAMRFLPLDEKRSIASQVALLDEALAAITRDAAGAAAGCTPAEADGLPRLREVLLDETDAVRLCGVGGVVDRLVTGCEERLLARL